mgnify:CR=1 FL=1
MKLSSILKSCNPAYTDISKNSLRERRIHLDFRRRLLQLSVNFSIPLLLLVIDILLNVIHIRRVGLIKWVSNTV